MKLIFKLIILFLFSGLYQINAQPGYADEWKKTRLYGHAFASQGFNAEQYKWIRDHFEYMCLEKTHGKGNYKGPSHEKASRDVAAKLVKQNPRSKPIMIYSISHAYPQFFESEALAVKTHPEYFAKDGKHLNLVNPDENTWYANVIDSNCDNSDLVGIFVDGVNWAVQKGFKNEVVSILDQVKSFTLLNGFHPTKKRDKLIDGLELLEHADGIFVDSWFRRLCDNTTAAQTLISSCLQVPNDKVMILNSANDIGGLWGDDHKFSHAAYLIVAHDKTYYRWAGDGKWGADVLMNWHEDFDKEMGKPLSTTIKTGNSYKRVFEHCTVNINIETKESSVVWNENNTLVNAQGVSISCQKNIIKIGETLQFKHVFTPLNATYQGITWGTSNHSIATISETGLLTAKGEGTVTIIGKTSEGEFSSSYTIKVLDK